MITIFRNKFNDYQNFRNIYIAKRKKHNGETIFIRMGKAFK